MPSFSDIETGKTPAAAEDIQQIIRVLSGRQSTPLTTFVNEALSYALTLKNTDPGGKGLVIYAPDGATVLLQVDAGGVRISRDGSAAVQPVTQMGSAPSQAAEGTHVHGEDGYSSSAITSLETLFANSWRTVSAAYTLEAGVLFVICTAGITVTLPVVNRPVWIAATSGSVTVVSQSGQVLGGSVNTTTGLIMDGTINPPDSIGYKWDGTNYRAMV